MTQFTRSNRKKRGSIRKKRLQKSWLHRLFGAKNIWQTCKTIFKGKIILVTITLGMLGFILFALFSPYFSLSNIQVETKNQYPSVSEIQKHLQKFKTENLFLLSKKDVKKHIKNKFTEIETVSVNTKWPKTLQVSYQSLPAVFNIINEESANKFTISATGIVLQNIANSDLSTIKIQQHPKFLKIRDQVFTAEDIEKIKQAEKQLFEKLDIIPAERIYLYKAQELHIVTKQKQATIWIDLQQDINEQVEKLTLAEKRIRFQSKRFNHIDLRIPKQIFWEWK